MQQAKLTRRQIRILLVGHSAGMTGRGFISENEELNAWFKHRAALLDAAGSARPAAYFKFELCEQSPEWIRAAESLFRGGIYHARNVARLEEMNITLSGDQPPGLNGEFETVESIRALERSLADLEQFTREFGHAQAWHAYRDRPELAAKYARIGAALRQVLRQSLPVLKVEKEN
jgi:hypothetical protein